MKKLLVALVTVVALLAAACSSSDDTNVEFNDTDNSESPAASSASQDAAPVLEPIDQLRFIYPETLAFAAPFTQMSANGPLSGIANEISFSTWTSPDVLRSLLIQGDAEVAAVPTNVAANLANKDVDVRMLAVLVWGLLYVIGPDGAPADWEQLRGQTVMVPFQNDMPDLVFQHLAQENGLTPGVDFTIDYYAAPPEIVGKLVQGDNKWAVLPEHVATLALVQANAQGQSVGRVFDLQAEWADATGLSARIPQAGVIMPGALVDERPDVVTEVFMELVRAVGVVNAAEELTLAQLSESSGLPVDIVRELIPRLNLDVVSGFEAQEDLEKFYTVLSEGSPDIIGGGLPDGSFYVAAR